MNKFILINVDLEITNMLPKKCFSTLQNMYDERRRKQCLTFFLNIEISIHNKNVFKLESPCSSF